MKLRDVLKNKKVLGAICGVVAIAVIGTGIYVNREQDFPVFVHEQNETTQKEEPESPLGDGNVSVDTKSSTKTSSKTVKLAKASTKTYTKNLGTKTTVTTTDSETNEATIKVEERKDVNRRETYTKGAKTKKVTTSTTTTVTTTTTKKPQGETKNTNTQTTTNTSSSNTAKTTEDIFALAAGMDSRILSAFDKLGFTVVIDPSFNQGDGLFDAKTRTITLRSNDRGHAIHEMGHFLAFINSISQKSQTLLKAYNGESKDFTGTYYMYATSDPNEYFAECTREYFVGNSNKSALMKKCPDSAQLIEACVNNIDSELISKVAKKYK